MKALISGVSLIILFLHFNLFQLDFDSHLRALEKIKFQSEDCAVAGALCVKDEYYALGKMVYDIEKSEKSIRSLLIKNLKLNDDMSPVDNSWWVGEVHYNVFYYDDTGQIIHMRDGKEISRALFDYGDIYHDVITNYEYFIAHPTVVVRLEVDGVRHRSNWFDWGKLVRVSSYEYYR